ncbi:MAG TPA: DUF4390 domain-containing protein [Dokdonella sp.]
MRCWKSTERLLVLLAGALLAGCGVIAQQTPGTLVVRDARVDVAADAATLDLGLDCRLSGPMQDALDHGIPITLRIDLRAGRWPRASAAAKRIELRYFPLSRRYQLHDLDVTEVRSYSSPGYLVAALGSLRLGLPKAFATLPPGTPLQLSARIDPSALPGALRLPALFEPAWRLASADFAWTPAAR